MEPYLKRSDSSAKRGWSTSRKNLSQVNQTPNAPMTSSTRSVIKSLRLTPGFFMVSVGLKRFQELDDRVFGFGAQFGAIFPSFVTEVSVTGQPRIVGEILPTFLRWNIRNEAHAPGVINIIPAKKLGRAVGGWIEQVAQGWH